MTSFRNKLAVVAMLLVGMGCANETESYVIDRFFPIVADNNVTCTFPGDIEKVFISGGLLDVAAGSPQYFVGIRLKSLYAIGQDPVVLRTGEVLEGENRNRPIFTAQRVTYRPSRRLGTTPKVFVLNQHIPVDPKAGTADMLVQLLSPEFATQLFENLTPSNTFEDFVDVQIDVEFTGEMGATKTPIRSGVATLPLRVYRSAPTTTCAGGDVYRRFLKVDPADPNSSINLCSYVGQAYQQEILPAVPATCCTPGTVGC